MTRFVNAPNIQNFVNSAVNRVRYFLGFDSTLNSYGQLGTAWQPIGSFNIKGKFSTTDTTTARIYNRWDPTGNNRSAMILISSNQVTFFVSDDGNNSVSAQVSYATVGKFSTFEVTFNANTNIIVDVDGVTATTTHSYSSVYDADTPTYFGSETGDANFFTGVLADFELIDLDVPANSQAYRLDRATGTTESSLVNTGTLTYNNILEANRFLSRLVGLDWVGNEEITNGNFATASDWSLDSRWSYGVNSAIAASSSGGAFINQTLNLTEGAIYKSGYSANNFTGSGSVGFSSSIFDNGTLSANGVFSDNLEAKGGDFRLFSGVGVGFALTDVTVKRILEAP